MSEPKLRLVKFGAAYCPPCRHMDRAKTLEKFVERHPNVVLKKLDVADENGHVPPGSAFDEANQIAYKRKVVSIPTLIFETPDGKELVRHVGSITARNLERLYLDALDELDETEE